MNYNKTSLTRIIARDIGILSLFNEVNGLKHRDELVSFLKGFRVGGPTYLQKYAVDMYCLAAQVVSHFKTKPGGFYIANEDAFADCYYDVYISDNNQLYIDSTIGDVVTKIKLSETEYEEIAEFVYYSTDSKISWRRIGVQREDDEYIGGVDLEDNNRYKLFRCDRILGGKSKIFKTKV